jgi:hypothetical protein
MTVHMLVRLYALRDRLKALGMVRTLGELDGLIVDLRRRA